MSLFSQVAAATAMNIKGLPKRAGASLVTVIGVATTVAVMISLLAIGAGIVKTANRNITEDRVIVMPSGAQSEFTGSMSREAADLIAGAPGVKHDASGKPIASPGVMVIVEVEDKKTGDPVNVPIRGMTPMGLVIDPKMQVTEGRMFRPAVHELIVGQAAKRQFKHLNVGDHIALRGSDWTVVGAFDAKGGMEDNLIVGDADTVMAAFDRNGYQSVLVQLDSPAAFNRFKDALTADPRLDVEAKRYKAYIQGQMKQLTTILNFVGYFVGVVMAIGAIISALNTMYSAVDARVREIATLRAIGFGGTAVVVSVMVESLVLAIPGALLGAGLAWLVFNGHSVHTLNLTFPLAVTWPLVVTGIVFSLVIGLIGGFAPAMRAAGLPVAAALRAT
jgi:putative ABC transport system permease protein